MADYQSSHRVAGTAASPGRALDTIAMCLVSTLVVAALYLGREIFQPIAVAVILSFILAPPIRFLRRWGLGRILPVIIVVTVTFGAILVGGTILARQVTELADDLPRYQVTIGHKIESVRGAATEAGFIERASNALKSLGAQLSRNRSESQDTTPAPPDSSGNVPSDALDPVPVEVHQPPAGPFEVLEKVLATVFAPLATTGIVAVFVVFILLQREDLRDRMIRLAGSQDLQRTTVALDDAARRLSRFFLVQTAINATFGIIVAIGLSIIGVPSPILWGFVAMFMRFVPYIGSVVAAAFPIVLAAAVDPGWNMVIETAALFLIGEPIMGQVVEPLLYGHSTGLSPIAVVIAATFWTWLWGPVGLLLATPLTVCLVVLGRHFEKLEFLDVLLGDAPPLTPCETFYQRALAGHATEAADQAEHFLEDHALDAYWDEIALPGLLMAQNDLRRGTLDEDRQARIRDTVAELVDDLEDEDETTPKSPRGQEEAPAALAASAPPGPVAATLPAIKPEELSPDWRGPTPVLCVAARSPLDEAAAMMLAQVLRKHGIGASVAPPGVLGLGGVGQLPAEGVALVCLSYLDADLNPAHVRFAVRRLRRHLPNARILAGFWAGSEARRNTADWCSAARADHCAISLAGAVEICLDLARGETPETTAARSAPPRPIAVA